MLEKIKNNFVAFLLGIIVAICGLVGMIGFFISNGIAGYSFQNGFANFLAVMLFVLPILYTVCILLLGSENPISVVLGLVVVFFAVTLVFLVIDGRILTIAGVFSYDAKNATAWSAVYSAVVAVIGCLLTGIVMVVAGFVGKEKK